jgi:hypothetical protein
MPSLVGGNVAVRTMHRLRRANLGRPCVFADALLFGCDPIAVGLPLGTGAFIGLALYHC